MTVDYKEISEAWDSQKPYGRSGGKSFWLAIRVAIEKQIPKKIAYQIGKNGLNHEKCPTCGSFHVFGNYCTECGQRLNWGNE